MSTPDLRKRLGQKQLVVAPGVLDMVSLRCANQFGFDALYMTGFGDRRLAPGPARCGARDLHRHGRPRQSHGVRRPRRR